MTYLSLIEDLARAAVSDREREALRPREITSSRRSAQALRSHLARLLVSLAAHLDRTAAEPARRTALNSSR